jgi:hypothetical protein
MKNILSNCTILLIVLISLAGCGTFQSTPSPIPVTPTPTYCPFTSNPGPTPPEVEKRAKENFYTLQVSGIRGSLDVTAYGEYSCDNFAVKEISFEYTIAVNDLEDQTAIREIVAKLKDSAKNSLEGRNMGEVRIRFVAGKECRWAELQNACTPIMPLTYP